MSHVHVYESGKRDEQLSSGRYNSGGSFILFDRIDYIAKRPFLFRWLNLFAWICFKIGSCVSILSNNVWFFW